MSMTEEELFEQARVVNFAYKEAVAGAQLEILDADWQISAYGDSPWECPGDASRYEFDLTRRTPEGWRLDGTPMELAEEVGAWLDENGWTDIKTRGYSGEIADVVVEAEYPEEHVDLLVVDISPGELFDSVTISATSTCEPGDYLDIVREQVPGFADNDPIELHDERKAEHPTAPLSFGFNDDGTPRFWNDSE
ncbi:hypothetical protein [Microbacterium galbinum]|uniref:hypothetical protein n=1 Tax=Microbacterium galbinum TaxID=2851646 RepID=UPI001FFC60F4|nr:hypothetical protein [Microbacterium galbinum]MCK2029717.1 hypothetical protein [Microbacterium galbinum]